MVVQKKDFFNPVFVAVFIILVLIYGKIINVPDKNSLKTIAPLKDIVEIEGILMSSPVKVSSGKYYSSSISTNVINSVNNIKSTSTGIINIMIPSEIIESYLPGKLYTYGTHISEAALWEKGGAYYVSGKVINNIFYVSELKKYDFSKIRIQKLWKFRALMRLQFKRLMYSWQDAGGFFLALITGAREYTEQTLKDGFRDAGISHILALSGMHLSLFSGLVMFVSSKLKRKRLSLAIQLITIFFFVWFAGFSPSLMRAFICNLMILIANVSNIESPDMKIVLSCSFLLQLMISPLDYNNAGFLLSYGALAGIILFNDFFYSRYSLFIPKRISSSLAASTSAQITTIPLSLALFSGFSPFGIFATLIISPLVTIFIYTGIVLFIMSLIIPGFSDTSGIIMNFLYTIIKFIVIFFANLPGVKIESSRL